MYMLCTSPCRSSEWFIIVASEQEHVYVILVYMQHCVHKAHLLIRH